MSAMQDQCAITLAQTIPTLPGWCSHSKAQRLLELVVREKPLRSIELGVFGGRSFLALALGQWTVGHGKAIGVDPWTVAAALEGTNSPENDAWWGALDIGAVQQQAFDMMTRVVPPQWWEFSCRPSLEHARDLSVNPIKYGLIHQDSNHSAEISCAELEAYLPLCYPGALWVMDDVQWPTLQKVQGLMLEQGFVLEEDFGDWRAYRVPR